MRDLPSTTTQIRLVSRPSGALRADDFDSVEVPIAAPNDGEVLVGADYLMVAAVMRELAEGNPDLPMPSYRVGEPPWGNLVGTVLASRADGIDAGDLVNCRGPWAEHVVLPADAVKVLPANALPAPHYHLSNGPTAWYGMRHIADVGDGDVVFVSGAAGGVGSLAGQIARNLGAARVIGSAGSTAKVRYLVDELGFDAAFDYHDTPVVDRLRELAPDGITVVFDLVGGEQFEAAVAVAAPHARFAIGGQLASQLGGVDGRPRLDIGTAMIKDLRLHAFALAHHLQSIAEWPPVFGRWLAEKRIVFGHTVVPGGITAVPRALVDLIAGKFTGNVTVRISAADPNES